MNIVITGATGLIGSAVMEFLHARGHNIVPLKRKPEGSKTEVYWCPERREVNLTAAGEVDAIIHLAGENIAQHWTDKAKRRIRESRVDGTRLLVDAMLRLPKKPAVFLCASATGIYGDRGDEILDEQSAPGKGFLAEVCQEWEAATERASQAGIRVVNLRFGVVLSGRGGALAKMLPAFRLGVGGKLGDGKQYWSWMAIDDLVRVVELALLTGSVQGPINVISPNAVPNVEFTRILASVLHRPAFCNVPKFALKLLMGEMAEEALLSSFRVKPVKLEQYGFRFDYPQLRQALEHLLKASERSDSG